MTTAEAATYLQVSQRQVERLAQYGAITRVKQVGRVWMVDVESVTAWAKKDRHRGRPWDEATAWAGLWQLSGLDIPWLTGQATRRLNERLATIDEARFSWVCRTRAQVKKFRVSESFVPQLATCVRTSGLQAVEPGRDLLSPSDGRVEGYVTSEECHRAVDDYFMVDDPSGNAVLRVTDFPVVDQWSGVMPVAVVAMDLIDCADPRASAAGQRLMGSLLR